MAKLQIDLKDKTKATIDKSARKAGLSTKEYIINALGLHDEEYA